MKTQGVFTPLYSDNTPLGRSKELSYVKPSLQLSLSELIVANNDDNPSFSTIITYNSKQTQYAARLDELAAKLMRALKEKTSFGFPADSRFRSFSVSHIAIEQLYAHALSTRVLSCSTQNQRDSFFLFLYLYDLQNLVR